MSRHIDRLATEVIDCEHPSVTTQHAHAGTHARFAREAASAGARRCFKANEARAHLAAVLAWMHHVGRILCPAEALRVAARLAERAAAADQMAMLEARAAEMNTLAGEPK